MHQIAADITLDFETYYSADLSLKHLTYEEYVRHPDFQIIMCSFKIASTGELYYVVGEDEVWKELDRLQVHRHGVCAHNMAFDGMILTDLLDFTPRDYLCTMHMAKFVEPVGTRVSLAALARKHELPDKGTAVHDMMGRRLEHMTKTMLREYGDYCVHDTDLCHTLAKMYQQQMSQQDLNTISATLRMGADAVFQLNGKLLQDYLPLLAQQREDRMASLCEHYKTDTTTMRKWLRSPKKFIALLQETGIEPPKKVSASTGKLTYATAKTDPEFKDLLEHEDPLVQALVEAKMGVGSSIAETRAQRFVDIASRGPLPVPLIPFGAHTSRWAATQKINLQNLPKRGGDKTLRRSMEAPAGHVVMACDLSQIEARRLADIAGELYLLKQFLNGEDIYSIFATKLYGFPVDKSKTQERNVGKECILSLGYSSGAVAFQRRLRGAHGITVSAEFAESAVDLYRNTNMNIVNLWKQCAEAVKVIADGGHFPFGSNHEFLATKGQVELADGYVLRYPNTRIVGSDDYGRPVYVYDDHHKAARRIYAGVLCNNITQASAARILQWQMVQMREQGLILRGTVHDELIALPSIEEVPHYKQVMESVMSSAPAWAARTPVACELDIGWNYADLQSPELFLPQIGLA